MAKQLISKLGIWGNESCEMCGACCYNYNKNKLCKYQEIKAGKSYCSMHENPSRDMLCQIWFCNDLNDPCNHSLPSDLQERVEHELREIAYSLGTAPIVLGSSTPPKSPLE